MSRSLTDSDTPEQRKIRQTVEWYKIAHPEEYQAFVAQMKIARETLLNEFAQMQGSPHRAVHEIPETMFDKLIEVFTPDEMKWFSTIRANRWFVKTFPEFAIAKKI